MPSYLDISDKGASVVSGDGSNKKPKWIPRKQYLKARRQGILASQIQYIDYEPRGACKEIFQRRDLELGISGPAGTGKSRACLEKVNWCCDKYPHARWIMVRKTRRSLTQSAMVTFENKVLSTPGSVPFHGGDQEYRYGNGSILAVAGIDDPRKIYSSEWDGAYVNQAEELDQADWESIISRLRNWKMPYQQIIGDMNPDAPTHWIKARVQLGQMTLLESRHEDNPELYDIKTKEWTIRGAQYLKQLDALSGVRYRRLRLGQWASAEGAVYEETWDRALHVIDRFVLDPLDKDQVPSSWPRYWSIDFGYTNPFVWQAWAEDPDGRLFRYKEIYKTKTLVEDHARRIKEVTKDEPRPRVIICDHDAEDRATLERHLDMPTQGAWKAVGPGIQALEGRLRTAGDGKPRVFYLRDSVIDIDRELIAAHKPACTEDEFEVYVWDTSANRRRGEQPVKEYDHGMDASRYLVTYIDKTGSIIPKMFGIIGITRGGGGSDSSLVKPSGFRIDGGTSLGTRWSDK